MQPSAEVRDTLLRFYEVFSPEDPQSVTQMIAQQAEVSWLSAPLVSG